MGGLIRRLTAFFLFNIQKCGSERRRVCCAGMEQSLLRQVYRHLFSISTCFPFFVTGTRTSGLARVTDCFGTTRTGFLRWVLVKSLDRYLRSSRIGRETYGSVARTAWSDCEAAPLLRTLSQI